MDNGLEKQKQVLLDFMKDEQYVPMRKKDIAVVLNIPRERKPELRQALIALLEEGKIVCSSKGKFSVVSNVFLTGTFCGNPMGYGFVQVPDMDEDIFIPSSQTAEAMDGDTVKVQLAEESSGKRKEGRVVKVLEHAVTKVIGYFYKENKMGFVRPDNQKLYQHFFVKWKNAAGARQGEKVVIEIMKYATKNTMAEGRVIEIIGDADDPKVEITAVARAYGLVEEFSEEVFREIDTLAPEVPEEAKNGRRDLRDVEMVTIDGEDAKDLDDAVSVSYDGQNYYLGVHIADVSHYVKENSALDKEAYNRGTSVYLADRVIPMLPRKLSNGLCSLNEGVDRLALSCLMTVDGKGNIIDHEIVESVINVNRRMSYTQVQAIVVDKDEEQSRKFEELVPMFLRMAELSALLRAKRKKRGSIDFNFPDPKIILDDEGHTVDIVAYEHNTATRLIEDFMLAANETIAEDFFWRGIPFLYRTHEKPDSEKIQRLSSFVHSFGLILKGNGDGDVHPKEIQKLITSIEGKPEEALISRVILKSLKRAKYTPDNDGHYGLAATYYCHFTSPIRRYPDLQIHRIIKECLHGKLNENRLKHYESILEEVGFHCSKRERNADEAEYESVKVKRVDYMLKHADEVFDGVISGIQESGFYVELSNTIEGKVHVRTLPPDEYEANKEAYEIVGKKFNRHYKLGQNVRVRLKEADTVAHTIEFCLVEDKDENE